MTTNKTKSYLIPFGAMFIGLPLLLWKLGDFPPRTLLKESLSVLTLIAFFLMLGLFFGAGGGKTIFRDLHMGNAVKIHKFVGYIVVSFILVHPFLIVLPRYYEAGVDPIEAFLTIITTVESQGVVLGMIAWFLMVILALTSMVRKLLPMKYTTWRLCHGILSILFISIATWHAVDLGRHTNRPISIAMITLAGIGILLLLKTYSVDLFKRTVEK